MNYRLPSALLGLLLMSSPLHAETITIPVGQQSNTTASHSLPQQGASRASVTQRYGQPTTRHPAVGQPPISRWDYPDFSVYFEYEHVIHSVVRQHTTPAN